MGREDGSLFHPWNGICPKRENIPVQLSRLFPNWQSALSKSLVQFSKLNLFSHDYGYQGFEILTESLQYFQIELQNIHFMHVCSQRGVKLLQHLLFWQSYGSMFKFLFWQKIRQDRKLIHKVGRFSCWFFQILFGLTFCHMSCHLP